MKKLWCVHVPGPDELYPAPSLVLAVLGAIELNSTYTLHPDAEELGVLAEIAVWPHDAESHAEGLKDWDSYFKLSSSSAPITDEGPFLPGELSKMLGAIEKAFANGPIATSADQGSEVCSVPLARDHTSMRVDYTGLLSQCRQELRQAPMRAEMLNQLQGHIQEMGSRFYAGDLTAVDEFLQLYCVEQSARKALAHGQATY